MIGRTDAPRFGIGVARALDRPAEEVRRQDAAHAELPAPTADLLALQPTAELDDVAEVEASLRFDGEPARPVLGVLRSGDDVVVDLPVQREETRAPDNPPPGCRAQRDGLLGRSRLDLGLGECQEMVDLPSRGGVVRPLC
ncbi:MAG: hypothetical protein N2Z82_06890 [Thermomicrobium sp.]|nr:hypothetical protein [Thermomicrobium sp.]